MSTDLPRNVVAQIVREAMDTDGSPVALDGIATAHGLLFSELVALLKQHNPKPRAVPPPTPSPVGSVPSQRTPTMQMVTAPERDLIATTLLHAEQSTSTRIRNKAKKVRALLDDLTAALDVDKEREQARKEVERLEAQLRAAKAKLGGKPTLTTASGPKSSDVRAWARANGVDCPAVGRVPQSVADAYLAAQGGAA